MKTLLLKPTAICTLDRTVFIYEPDKYSVEVWEHEEVNLDLITKQYFIYYPYFLNFYINDMYGSCILNCYLSDEIPTQDYVYNFIIPIAIDTESNFTVFEYEESANFTIPPGKYDLNVGVKLAEFNEIAATGKYDEFISSLEDYDSLSSEAFYDFYDCAIPKSVDIFFLKSEGKNSAKLFKDGRKADFNPIVFSNYSQNYSNYCVSGE